MMKQYGNDFPILAQEIHGYPLRYLDNAATALKPQCVIDAVLEYYSKYSANVHRGIHTLSEKATTKLEEARETVAHFIGAQTEEIIFTSGTTESLNGVAQMLARTTLQKGDEVVVTYLEHHSNIVPWFQIPHVTVRFSNITNIENTWTQKTKVLAITMMSNAIGTPVDLKPIIQSAHKHGILVVVDAAQGVVHHRLNVHDLDCDFLAFSGHKLYGPTGIGVLYGKKALLNTLKPWKGGGGMVREVTEEGFTRREASAGFEAGTPHIAGAIGLAEAIRYVERIGIEEIAKHEHELWKYARNQLAELPEVTIYGASDLLSSIVSFNIRDIHAHDVSAILDSRGIAIRAGHHCCQPLMKQFGINGTARVSFALYNTREDVDALITGIRKVIETFA